jgi:hypothetical protein
MKKDLSAIAKELFSNLTRNTYEELLYSYNTDGKKNINPRLTFDEAINKYTAPVLNVMENKANWKNRGGSLFVDFHSFLTVFKEFFPVYMADNGTPYLDIGVWNHSNGEKIVSLLITEIFYLNYTGMDIKDIVFMREKPLLPEIIRIFLRLSEVGADKT